MKFTFQSECMSELDSLVLSDRHSLLIEGPPSCGKTYLASQFADKKNISDFKLIYPTVAELRETIDECIQIDTDVVICIENLDLGVVGASYTILKFLEEPTSNVYIVVTCRNINRVPDTIISRSSVITVGPPTYADIDTYAKHKYSSEYERISSHPILKCCKTFGDIDTVCKFNSEQLQYFTELLNVMKFNDAVSNIVWTLGHFKDNTETPVELVIQFIMSNTSSNTIRQSGISCLKDLSSGRIAKHTVLTKFAFECKYLE